MVNGSREGSQTFGSLVPNVPQAATRVTIVVKGHAFQGEA